MSQAPQPVPDFVGEETQIGSGPGGMKPLAQHGRVVIMQGVLTLYGTKGDIIDSAPLTGVELKKSIITAGQGVWAHMNGKKYFLSVGHGATQLGPLSAAPALQMGQSIAGTQEFIKAFEALSGRKI